MYDDDVAAVVIDNGSGMCKAGFAGDDAPRAVPLNYWTTQTPAKICFRFFFVYRCKDATC